MVQMSHSGRRKVFIAPSFACMFYGFISFAGLATIYVSWSIIRYVHEENELNPVSNRHELLRSHPKKISSLEEEDSSALKDLRKKALKAAKKETLQRIDFEKKEMAPLNEMRQEYVDLIEAQAQADEEKQLQEQLKIEEDAYYEYYEDSSDADSTIITMAYDADFIQYIRFVSSLRDNGYGGKIMIGMEKDEDPEIIQYLKTQNVTIQTLIPTECTFESAKPLQKCYQPYSHIRREWSHFSLVRDWLSSCSTCSGPVLFMSSMKRAYFQKNPFGAGSATKKRLHLFQQHRNLDASFTSDTDILQACYDIDFPSTLLIDPADPEIGFNGMMTSDIALGKRDDVLDYLSLVYSMIREWMQREECNEHEFPVDIGSAIVNYLYIKDRLPFNARIVPHRVGEINNAVYEGKMAYESHLNLFQSRGLSLSEAENTPYEGSTEKSWIDAEYLLTNEDGDFINVFHEKSVVIIDYETYGKPFLDWLDKKMNFTTSNYVGNVVENKARREKNGKNDDFYIKVGDQAKASKVNENKIRKKKPKKLERNIDYENEGELNDDTEQNEETTGMYYAPNNDPEQKENEIPDEHDRSNKVPVEITYEEIPDE